MTLTFCIFRLIAAKEAVVLRPAMVLLVPTTVADGLTTRLEPGAATTLAPYKNI